jgi:hypothetical protein
VERPAARHRIGAHLGRRGRVHPGLRHPAAGPAAGDDDRLAARHITVGVLGMRVASHFGGPPDDYSSHRYPGDAATALDQLDEAYAGWIAGVRGLGPDGLARACGPAEGPWATASMAELVLHINREMLHHGAEVALLRDLYLWQDNGANQP